MSITEYVRNNFNEEIRIRNFHNRNQNADPESIEAFTHYSVDDWRELYSDVVETIHYFDPWVRITNNIFYRQQDNERLEEERADFRTKPKNNLNVTGLYVAAPAA